MAVNMNSSAAGGQEDTKKPRPNYTQDVTNKVIALMEGSWVY